MGFLDAATNAVNQAKTLVADTGPASGLSQIFDSVTGFISDVAGIVNGGQGPKMPLPNPLSKYASYTYSIGFGCISDNEANNPDATYMKGGKIDLICKSAGADPNNRVQTPYGKVEFYVDDLVLSGQVGFQNGANSNIIDMSFTVREPYSMGLLPIALQLMSRKKGYNNWRDATYILTIEFRGNTENGQIQRIPNTFRCIPFILTDWDMTVDQTGAVYKIEAMATNMTAFANPNHNVKNDVRITGASVVELLQSGPNSLQVALNERQQMIWKDKPGGVPDQYIILFPKNTSSAASGNKTGSEDNTGATLSPYADANNSVEGLLKKIGVSLSKESNNLVQQISDLNELGQSIIDFTAERPGDKAAADPNKVYNTNSGTFAKGKIVYDEKQHDFKFPQGSDISNAINQVLMQSDFIKNTFKRAPTAEGYRGWWRIDTKVYKVDTTANDRWTNEKPKIFVYRVTPYNTHAGHLISANLKAPGLEERKRKAVKVYDYIYTGKNTDIIGFKFTFDNGFGTFLSGDSLNRSGDAVLNNSQSQKINTNEDKTKVDPLPEGNSASNKLGVIPNVVKFFKTLTGTDRKGGGGLDSEEVRAARMWHDAITSSTQSMQTIDLEIIGDPYYIMCSGTGNYTALPGPVPGIKSDGSINFEDGEVDIVVNFRTPTDINQNTGLYTFKSNNQAIPLLGFSGLYRVIDVESRFSQGKFTQMISADRRIMQESDVTATAEQLYNTNKTTPVKAEEQTPE